MSKYTTELRFICETLARYNESQGYTKINEIIQTSRPLIFDFSYPIFSDEYKPTLETNIIKHYYTREIGLETYGLWKLKLDAKMNLIMPYFNQLYKSALIEINPLLDFSSTHTSERQTNSKTSENFSSQTGVTGETTNNISNNENGSNLYSNTPQGELTDIQNGNYLSEATFTRANGSTNSNTNNTSNTTLSSENSNTTSDTDKFTETTQGYNTSLSKLLLEYRGTFINIDKMVIAELEPLFMNIF